MCVAASADDFVEVALGTFLYIFVHFLGLEELGVEHAGQDAPVVGDRWLVEQLGVADVALGDLVEWVAMALRVFLDFLGDLVRFGGHLASHGVLSVDNARIDVGLVDEKARLFSREKESGQSHLDIK